MWKLLSPSMNMYMYGMPFSNLIRVSLYQNLYFGYQQFIYDINNSILISKIELLISKWVITEIEIWFFDISNWILDI